jgi:hypothetical protein
MDGMTSFRSGGYKSIRAVATSLIVYGAFLSCLALGAVFIFSFAAPQARLEEAKNLLLRLTVGAGFLLGFGLCVVVAGVQLAKRRPWARAALEAIAWFSLISVLGGSLAGFLLIKRSDSIHWLWIGATITLAYVVYLSVMLVLLRSDGMRKALNAPER